jgi:hypothetical protein
MDGEIKSQSGKERVKRHRQRRKELGLREIKLWVREVDVRKIYERLRPFMYVVENLLHEANGGKWPKRKLGKTDQMVIKE